MSETLISKLRRNVLWYIIVICLQVECLLSNLGQRIKAARELAGFTQERLAEKIGVSRTAVARWESGDIEPKLQNLICLSEFLKVSSDSLLGISDSKSPALINLSDEAIFALERFMGEIKSN